MDANVKTITEFLSHNKTIFSIPVYQRNYEWKRAQCYRLFHDLEGLVAHPYKHHFMGAIIYSVELGSKGSFTYHIIDGQQRITSFMLLLSTISKVVDNDTQDDIEESFLFNNHLHLNHQLKLRPVERDRYTYEKTIKGTGVNIQPSKLKTNHQYFQKLIHESPYSPYQLYTALNRIDIAKIVLDNSSSSENPQEIFEAINSTGISLTDADLIRNFLFMGLSPDSQEELYHDYWMPIEHILSDKIIPEFIRHYLIMKEGKKISKQSIYTAYKIYFQKNQYTTSQALKELYQYAIDYYHIRNAQTTDSHLNYIFNDINIIGKTITYPYFLKLLQWQRHQRIDFSTIVRISNYVESYLYRSKICDYPSHRQNHIFVELCKSNDESKELKIVKNSLLENNFPTDTDFRKNLQANDLYHSHTKAIAKMTLANLEKSLSKETIDMTNAQIEHIMPQSLNKDWKRNVSNATQVNQSLGNTLGNLTLTKYNQNMGNANYDTKKKTYRESNISLTRNIADKYPKWNLNSILARAKRLSYLALQVWPMPKSINYDSNNVTQEHSLVDVTRVTGHKPIRLFIADNEYQVTKWKQLLVKLLEFVWEDDSRNFTSIKNNHKLNKTLFRSKYILPYKLTNGEIIETCFSSKRIIQIMQQITQVCDLTKRISYIMK